MHRLRDRLLAAAFALLLALAAVRGSAADGQQHRVALGDTLWGLSQLYGVSVDTLVALNHIANPNLIIVGQLLELPGGSDPSPQAAPLPDGGVYVVQPGDTLSGISLRFNVSIDALQETNGIADPNLIIAGQRITIAPLQAAAPVVPTPLVRPNDPETEAIIDELSAADGLDAGLVKALAFVESGWQQGVVSPADAAGVMQITPETAAWLEQDVFGEALNEDLSVYDNVKMGVRYLRILLNATGNTDTALTAYYQGLGATQAGLVYGETASYVEAVKAIKARFWP
ncbi:MAG TPA: LysM peptidoglycan-binding domain-containing protein [Dehalococcoidia bacterium]|nr:LysM peptidoglycan-binding domain-containing protein [Dehalococcoidia bacterium]